MSSSREARGLSAATRDVVISSRPALASSCRNRACLRAGVSPFSSCSFVLQLVYWVAVLVLQTEPCQRKSDIGRGQTFSP